jgi:hypothetical protein
MSTPLNIFYFVVLRQRDNFTSLYLCLVSLSFLHFLTPYVLPISLFLLCVYDDADNDNENSDDNPKQQHDTAVIV